MMKMSTTVSEQLRGKYEWQNSQIPSSSEHPEILTYPLTSSSSSSVKQIIVDIYQYKLLGNKTVAANEIRELIGLLHRQYRYFHPTPNEPYMAYKILNDLSQNHTTHQDGHMRLLPYVCAGFVFYRILPFFRALQYCRVLNTNKDEDPLVFTQTLYHAISTFHPSFFDQVRENPDQGLLQTPLHETNPLPTEDEYCAATAMLGAVDFPCLEDRPHPNQADDYLMSMQETMNVIGRSTSKGYDSIVYVWLVWALVFPVDFRQAVIPTLLQNTQGLVRVYLTALGLGDAIMTSLSLPHDALIQVIEIIFERTGQIHILTYQVIEFLFAAIKQVSPQGLINQALFDRLVSVVLCRYFTENLPCWLYLLKEMVVCGIDIHKQYVTLTQGAVHDEKRQRVYTTTTTSSSAGEEKASLFEEFVHLYGHRPIGTSVIQAKRDRRRRMLHPQGEVLDTLGRLVITQKQPNRTAFGEVDLKDDKTILPVVKQNNSWMDDYERISEMMLEEFYWVLISSGKKRRYTVGERTPMIYVLYHYDSLPLARTAIVSLVNFSPTTQEARAFLNPNVHPPQLPNLFYCAVFNLLPFAVRTGNQHANERFSFVKLYVMVYMEETIKQYYSNQGKVAPPLMQ
jgi:hypothetical protein